MTTTHPSHLVLTAKHFASFGCSGNAQAELTQTSALPRADIQNFADSQSGKVAMRWAATQTYSEQRFHCRRRLPTWQMTKT